MEHLISIIVPVYNVEKYLEKCVLSIVKQTYKCLEIIVVDDGAKDKSGEIADELAKSDTRIQVIHKKNGGLSSARNAGIEAAHGDYLMFIDSDDYISPNMCESLISEAIDSGSDLVECGMIKTYGSRAEVEENRTLLRCSGKEAVELFLTGNTHLKPVACDSLYHKDIFKNIRFEEGRLHEDGWFKYKAFYKAKRVSVIPQCLYYYVQSREGSIMTVKVRPKNIRDILDAFEHRWHYFEENGEKYLTDIAKAAYCRELLSYYYVVNGSLEDKNAVRDFSREIADKLKLMKGFVLKSSHLTKYRKKFLIFYYLRKPSVWISNLRKW